MVLVFEDPPVDSDNKSPLHIVFIHLDLGIGGAEQLILQLAKATYDINDYTFDIVTTRCDPNHCFELVKPTTGILYPYLKVWGQYIPHTITGKMKALLSTTRLLYISYCVCRYHDIVKKEPDIIVLDVLSTPLPLLRILLPPTTSLLFYCHYPDQLLVTTSQSKKSWYRTILDIMETKSMNYSDVTVVNSKFTQQTVLQTFPNLMNQDNIKVLYPALEEKDDKQKDEQKQDDDGSSIILNNHKKLLVSINRYERKKNIKLFIESIAYIRDELKYNIDDNIQVIIAGGYDITVIENVEYYNELVQLTNELNLNHIITFLKSISDTKRTILLKNATCCIYTPSNEHFGIVPLEAMYYQTPVIACQSGGPIETILHNQTGMLCSEPTSLCFGNAIHQIITMNKDELQKMGIIAKEHVITKFGMARLQKEWKTLLEHTVETRKKHIEGGIFYMNIRHQFFFILFSIIELGFIILGGYILRTILIKPIFQLLYTLYKQQLLLNNNTNNNNEL